MEKIKTVDEPDVLHQCSYCEKSFRNESSLFVHVCRLKHRYNIATSPAVSIGFQAYRKFYEMTQRTTKAKTYDEFAKSRYFNSFVKFGQYCIDIRAISVGDFIGFVIKNNVRLEMWAKDSVYTNYIRQHIRNEHINDALTRAITHGEQWAETHNHNSHEYLVLEHPNSIIMAVESGRISPWILYNCVSGCQFLDNLQSTQHQIIMPMIEPDFWRKKFVDYPKDKEYAHEILAKAGW